MSGGGKKCLEAQASAWERNAATDGVDQGRAQFTIIERADECFEMSDAWEEERLCACDRFGRGGALRFCSEPLQGSLNTAHVACALIQQANFHTNPLLLG